MTGDMVAQQRRRGISRHVTALHKQAAAARRANAVAAGDNNSRGTINGLWAGRHRQ